MLDNEIAAAVTSPEADTVTPLMSKVYLRLKTAPREFFESDGVLRFAGEEREGKWVTAWEQLRQHLHVSGETANKALKWMHDEGIIGYSAFKNGVGIKIFLNRAASSISIRPASDDKKILRFTPASAGNAPASVSETPYKVEISKNNLDKDIKSGAPKNGADTKTVVNTSSDPLSTQAHRTPTAIPREEMDEIVSRLRSELEPCVKTAATQAAAQAAAREATWTREWFETKALPKAVRVAQHETYDLLKKHGTVDARRERARSELQVGRATEDSSQQPAARPLTNEEIRETAEICVALLETQGKKVNVTLAEISAESGGWLLPEDAPKVREEAERLLRTRSERR